MVNSLGHVRKECLQGPISHRPPKDVQQGRLWLEGAANRECFLEHEGTISHVTLFGIYSPAHAADFLLGTQCNMRAPGWRLVDHIVQDITSHVQCNNLVEPIRELWRLVCERRRIREARDRAARSMISGIRPVRAAGYQSTLPSMGNVQDAKFNHCV